MWEWNLSIFCLELRPRDGATAPSFTPRSGCSNEVAVQTSCGVLFNQFKQKNCLILQGFFPHFGFFFIEFDGQRR